MTSEVAQVAGFKLGKTASLSLSDALHQAKTSGSFLENMLELLEPKQVATNEIAKDSYQECIQLKEHLSEQLWGISDTAGEEDVQYALDVLTRAIVSYEMMKDAAEGDWELVDVAIPNLQEQS